MKMRPTFAVLLVTSAIVSSTSSDLDVLRITPTDGAEPDTEIRITFDRPVAVDLNGTVDPSRIFSITPTVTGRAQWLDPVTLRFKPDSLLTPTQSYRVTIAASFTAMDGSRLAAPYMFTFRVRGPRVIVLRSAAEYQRSFFAQVAPTAPYAVLYTDPPGLGRTDAPGAYVLQEDCKRITRPQDFRPGRRIAARVSTERDVTRDDPDFYYVGNFNQPGAMARRRIVRIEAAEPLPADCPGRLELAGELGEGAEEGVRTSFFEVHGRFRIVSVDCGSRPYCPTGPIRVVFSTPVSGAEIARGVHILPDKSVSVRDTLFESFEWHLPVELTPRSTFSVLVDRSLADAWGQGITGGLAHSMRTTGFGPSVTYVYGRALVERSALRTVTATHINVDSLSVIVAPVSRDLEGRFISASPWQLNDYWSTVAAAATRRTIPVQRIEDTWLTTGIRLPTFNAQRPASPTLMAVRIDGAPNIVGNILVAQVTDLAVHAKIGAETGSVWVTGANDGAPRASVEVTLHGNNGGIRARAVTDRAGLAHFTSIQPDSSHPDEQWAWGAEGYIAAVAGSDRALAPINRSDPDLSPWRFNVSAAWEDADRYEETAALFTERGIYRPGEPLHVKAIVRDGMLGNLHAPTQADSVRWRFRDRENTPLRDTVSMLSSFGTADVAFSVPSDAPLGSYVVDIERRRQDEWVTVASTSYRVAEYRPPEFLVSVEADTAQRFAGDTVAFDIEARYLFGAAMGRAAVEWTARQHPTSVGDWIVPNTDRYYLGVTGYWWEDQNTPSTSVVTSGADTLDPGGHASFHVQMPAPPSGRPARVDFDASVTDVNRQVSSATASVLIHPASFYVGARPVGTDYFWRAGDSTSIDLIAVTPDGDRVTDVSVTGTILRREWHRVRRERNGFAELVGEWVEDTVATCAVQTDTIPSACRFLVPMGGQYIAAFSAVDAQGRAAITRFYRWATGPDWVPWNDESQFKMDVFPDRTQYMVGDTAEVLFASPFTDAEAWITVEREGIIEERRVRITSGSTTLRFPITEAFVPGAFVSIVVAKGRTAPPGEPDDPGRPTIRVGYAELRVLPDIKSLQVSLRPSKAEYAPGDTVWVDITVGEDDAGREAEVTLWAVDRGVLALTGYRVPDPVSLLYQARGLGMRLSSNLVSVVQQLAAADSQGMLNKGREPGGGGGGQGAEVLRSRFRPTAFFLGSVVTDSTGRVTARAPLPDNITTFRLMAVAVTRGDRYGHADTDLLVTRPLIARPALPRFLREGDSLTAGVVVNHRMGGTPTVRVTVTARDLTLVGPNRKTVTLEAGRGSEVRFDFTGNAADSAIVRFDVTGNGERDAVRTAMPVKPWFRPRVYTQAGVLLDSVATAFTLPVGLDVARSTLTFTTGSSPLAAMRATFLQLEAYPYYCSEQISSTALPLLALVEAERRHGISGLTPANATRQIQLAVETIERRQRPDGGIGFWSASDWSSPWLTSYAGKLLLAARGQGIAVRDSVVPRTIEYLQRYLRGSQRSGMYVAKWRDDPLLELTERVAAVEFLRAAGTPEVAAENQLIAAVAQMRWEDRVRLARLMHDRGDATDAIAVLADAWRVVRIDGNRAVLPDSIARGDYFYFTSPIRPYAELLIATMQMDPTRAGIGALVNAVTDRGRQRYAWWNTQDYALAILALAAFERTQAEAAGRPVDLRTRAGRIAVPAADVSAPGRESTVPLARMLKPADSSHVRLPVNLVARGAGQPIYFDLRVTEVPTAPPDRPDQEGIQVDRWYEDYTTGEAITRVEEGQLVRTHLRITVSDNRYFVVLDDPLPAGLEVVDRSLLTSAPVEDAESAEREAENDIDRMERFYGPNWSPFTHRELRDDRVVFGADELWRGSYVVSYVSRATTAGRFILPPAQAEEMYNPAVHGRSSGGTFTVTRRTP